MKKKTIIICLCLLLTAGLCTFRYIQLNQYYENHEFLRKSEKHEVYHIGEFVSLEDKLAGYSLQVNGFEIQDYDTVIASLPQKLEPIFGMPEDQIPRYDKLALISVTLKNTDNTDGSVFLPDLELLGIDSYIGMDWVTLLALNPILKGEFSHQLPQNSEIDLILPYSLQKEYFSYRTWKHLDEYALYLSIWSPEVTKNISLTQQK